MRIPGILFFALLVTSAITQIYSAPGGVPSKPMPESFGIEMTQRKMYKTKQSKEFYENSAVTNSKTVSKHLEIVHGDEGYISPEHMKPSGSNPSEKYRKDSGIIGPNPFEVDFLNNEKTKEKDDTSDTEVTIISKIKDFLSEYLGMGFDEIVDREDSWSLNHEIAPEEEAEIKYEKILPKSEIEEETPALEAINYYPPKI